ncbi:MAG: MGMT family protein [Bacteroidales bacterium]|nr:MGMT family protein [Bacteroidales bacterium]
MKPTGDDFFDKVFQVVRLIPPGRVSSYGAIASYLGVARSARMVGWALNTCNWFETGIPAHRVVNRKGLLTGKHYFGGQTTMADLLKSEGIHIENDQIINLEKYFWNPATELL